MVDAMMYVVLGLSVWVLVFVGVLPWLERRRERLDDEMRAQIAEFREKFPGRCMICSFAQHVGHRAPEPHDCIERPRRDP